MTPSAVAGANVRKARVRLGSTGAEVARRCGWSRDKQSKLERGERSVSVDDLLTLALVLGVAPAWLLADIDGDTPMTIVLEGIGGQVEIDGDELAAWLVGDHMQPFATFAPDQFYEFAPKYGRVRTTAVVQELTESGVLTWDDEGRWVMNLQGFKITGGKA